MAKDDDFGFVAAPEDDFGFVSEDQAADTTAPREDVSMLRTIVSPIAQGATLGYSDEIYGLGGALLGDRQEGESFWDRYSRHRDAEREKLEAIREESPIWSTTGEILGGIGATIGTGGLALKARGGAALGRAGLMKLGAAEGAAAGLGYSGADLTEGEIGRAALDTGIGAGIGAAMPKVMPKAIGLAGRAFSSPIRGAAIGGTLGGIAGASDVEEGEGLGQLLQSAGAGAAAGALAGGALGSGVSAVRTAGGLPGVAQKIIEKGDEATRRKLASLSGSEEAKAAKGLIGELWEGITGAAANIPVVRKAMFGLRSGLQGELPFGKEGKDRAEKLVMQQVNKVEDEILRLDAQVAQQMDTVINGAETAIQGANRELQDLATQEVSRANREAILRAKRVQLRLNKESNVVGNNIESAYKGLEGAGMTYNSAPTVNKFADSIRNMKGEFSETTQKELEDILSTLQSKYSGKLLPQELVGLKRTIFSRADALKTDQPGAKNAARLLRSLYGDVTEDFEQQALRFVDNDIARASPKLEEAAKRSILNLGKMNRQYSAIQNTRDLLMDQGFNSPVPMLSRVARKMQYGQDIRNPTEMLKAEDFLHEVRRALPNSSGIVDDAANAIIRADALPAPGKFATKAAFKRMAEGDLPVSLATQRRARHLLQEAELKPTVDSIQNALDKGLLENMNTPYIKDLVKKHKYIQDVKKEFLNARSLGDNRKMSANLARMFMVTDTKVDPVMHKNTLDMLEFFRTQSPEMYKELIEDLPKIIDRVAITNEFLRPAENINAASKYFGELTQRIGKTFAFAGFLMHRAGKVFQGTPTGNMINKIVEAEPKDLLQFVNVMKGAAKDLGMPEPTFLMNQLTNAANIKSTAERVATLQLLTRLPEFQAMLGDGTAEPLKAQDLSSNDIQISSKAAENILEGNLEASQDDLVAISQQMRGSDNERERRLGNVLQKVAPLPAEQKEELLGKLMSVQANKVIMEQFMSNLPKDIKASTPKTSTGQGAERNFDKINTIDDTQRLIDQIKKRPQTNATRRLQRILEISKTRDPQSRAAAMFAARQHPEFRQILKELEGKKD